MTLSKQKGPRKNGPFCLLIFISGGGSSAFYISIKVFAEMRHGECGKKASPLSMRREAESVSDAGDAGREEADKKRPDALRRATLM